MKKIDTFFITIAVGAALLLGGFGIYVAYMNFDVRTQSRAIPASLRNFSEGYEQAVLALGYAFIGLLLGLIPGSVWHFLDFFMFSPCKKIMNQNARDNGINMDELEQPSLSLEIGASLQVAPLSTPNLAQLFFKDHYNLALIAGSFGAGAIAALFGAYASYKNTDLLMGSQSTDMSPWARKASNYLLQSVLALGYGTVVATPIIAVGLSLKAIHYLTKKIVQLCPCVESEEAQDNLMSRFMALDRSTKIILALAALDAVIGLGLGIYFSYENFDPHLQSIHMSKNTRYTSEVLQQAVLALGESALAGLGTFALGVTTRIANRGYTYLCHQERLPSPRTI